MNNRDLEKHLPLMAITIALLAIVALLTLVGLPFLDEISAPAESIIPIDSNFKVPALPVDSAYLPTATVVFTWGMFGLGMVGVLLAVRDGLKRKTLVPLMLTLSAAVIAITEVYLDVMGCVWYPESEDTKAFTIIGRQMPWFIIAAWFGFGSPFMYMLYAKLRKGVTAREMWLLFLIAGLSSVPMEETLLHFGQYYYYGNQPLILFAKYPFWWMPCNAGGVLLAAALVYRFEDQLQGWRSLAILLITPMAVGGVYGFIAQPSWIVVNADYGWWVTQAAGVLTLLMGIMVVSLIIRFVLQSKDLDE